MSIEIGDRLKWIETIYGKQSSDVFFVEGADDITGSRKDGESHVAERDDFDGRANRKIFRFPFSGLGNLNRIPNHLP
eukprot:scaffold49857_cov71-Cyclotella_meneghiniana.AAC.8